MTTRIKVEITLRVDMKRVEARGHRADIFHLHKWADRWERRHGARVLDHQRTTSLVQTPIDHAMGWGRYVLTLASREPQPYSVTERRDIIRVWGHQR